VKVSLYRFPVIRRTRCGAWISDGVRPRFVLDGGRKRYALETPELPRNSLARIRGGDPAGRARGEGWSPLGSRRKRESPQVILAVVLASFVARKEKQIRIYQSRERLAREALQLAQRGDVER